MSKLWRFNALDTLFFRDGTPYHAGEGGQGQVAAAFPPYMNTLQGAIRTALAAGQGWIPEKADKWPAELGTPADLGQLTLRGPYLFKEQDPLFPAPLLYLQKKEGRGLVFTFLAPGGEIECDLGRKRLPQPMQPLKGAKAPAGCWLKAGGFEKILAGHAPGEDEIIAQEGLWKSENRTGIRLDYKNGTAQEGMIYSSAQARPEKDVSLGVLVSGVPGDWQQQAPAVVRLGGEGRLASIEICDLEREIVPPPVLQPDGDVIRFTVVLITPGYYEDVAAVIEKGPPGLPGACIAACTGKLEQVGGWDMANHCPRPLYPLVPAGSAWFFQAGIDELENIESLHGKCLGSKEKYGFGQIVIGTWRDAK